MRVHKTQYLFNYKNTYITTNTLPYTPNIHHSSIFEILERNENCANWFSKKNSATSDKTTKINKSIISMRYDQLYALMSNSEISSNV